jgi:hypothetical protein
MSLELGQKKINPIPLMVTDSMLENLEREFRKDLKLRSKQDLIVKVLEKYFNEKKVEKMENNT